MKKLSRIIVSGFIMTCLFGMTVFAAPSRDTTGIDLSKAEIISEKTISTEDAQKKVDSSQASQTVVVAPVAYDEAKDKAAFEALTEQQKAEAQTKANTYAASIDNENVEAVLAENGYTFKVKVTAPEAYMTNSIEDIAQRIADEAVKADGKVDVDVIAFADLEINGVDETAIAKGVSITIPIKGFKAEAGKTYAFAHLVDGVWKTEKITELGDGYIVVSMTSLSPVQLIKYEKVDDTDTNKDSSSNSNDTSSKDSSAASSDSNTSDSSSSNKSPKTGEALPVAGMVLGMSLVGAAVVTKKSYLK